MFVQLPHDGINMNGEEIMSYCTYKLCTEYEAFKNFGWENLYVKHQTKFLKIIDRCSDIHRLYLLSQLDMRDFDAVESWHDLSDNKLPRDKNAIMITNTLKDVVRDADPIYLDLVGEMYAYNKGGLSDFVELVTSSKKSAYPKLSKYKEEIKNIKSLQRLTLEFSINYFLELCPDPIKYNNGLNEKKKEEFNQYKFDYLADRYPNISLLTIRTEYQNSGFNLSRAVDKFDEIIQDPKNLGLIRKKRKTLTTGFVNYFGDIRDMDLLIELTFIEHKESILFNKETLDLQRIIELENAKIMDLLYDCQCCYGTEFLDHEISCCPKGHTFCLPCIKKFVEVEVGSNKLEFQCMTECNEMFNLEMLKQVVDDKLYQRLMRLKQAEDIKAANIEGLETCGFCDYSAIVPDDLKIFTCLNPDCKKETCRSCREENHIPLKCDENERTPELQVRTMIENKMSEVLIRVCPNCNNKFLKDTGCNRMKCICGHFFCYICKKEISPFYDHFYHESPILDKCPLFMTDNVMHVAVVEAAARIIEDDLRKTKPELLSKVDINALLPDFKTNDPLPPGGEEQQLSVSINNEVIAVILGEDIERINRLQNMRPWSSAPKRTRFQ